MITADNDDNDTTTTTTTTTTNSYGNKKVNKTPYVSN